MKPTMKALSVVLAFAVLGMSLPDAANAGKARETVAKILKFVKDHRKPGTLPSPTPKPPPKSGTNPHSDPNTNPNSAPNTNPNSGTDPNSAPNTNPNSGTDPNSDAGANANPGTDPKSRTKPSTGTDSGSNSVVRKTTYSRRARPFGGLFFVPPSKRLVFWRMSGPGTKRKSSCLRVIRPLCNTKRTVGFRHAIVR